MTVKSKRNGTIKFQDNTGNEMEVYFEEGDLSFEETKNHVMAKDRAKLGDMIEGEEEAVTGSFSTHFVQFLKQTHDPFPTPYEVLKRKNGAAHWSSTTCTRNSKTYTVKLIFEIEPTKHGDDGERITFNYLAPTKFNFEEGEIDKISFDFLDHETEPTVEKMT